MYWRICRQIHRHIGGLENQEKSSQFEKDIHRHIGGLEIEIV